MDIVHRIQTLLTASPKIGWNKVERFTMYNTLNQFAMKRSQIVPN